MKPFTGSGKGIRFIWCVTRTVVRAVRGVSFAFAPVLVRTVWGVKGYPYLFASVKNPSFQPHHQPQSAICPPPYATPIAFQTSEVCVCVCERERGGGAVKVHALFCLHFELRLSWTSLIHLMLVKTEVVVSQKTEVAVSQQAFLFVFMTLTGN